MINIELPKTAEETLEVRLSPIEKDIQMLKNTLSAIDNNIVELANYTKQNIQNINSMFVESRITKEVITSLLNIMNTKAIITGDELEKEMTSIAENASRKDIENSAKAGVIVKVDEVTEVSMVVFKNKNTNYAYEKSSLLPGSVGQKVGDTASIPTLEGKEIVQVDSEILEIYDVINVKI